MKKKARLTAPVTTCDELGKELGLNAADVGVKGEKGSYRLTEGGNKRGGESWPFSVTLANAPEKKRGGRKGGQKGERIR